MTTRNGKIAQLPKPIRDDVNHRLQNGEQGRELLKWLNDLPETKELLAKTNQQPINKSNLSDWRHGGFREWLEDQAREARIQRISETGGSLEKAETGDLFENFARIAVAELMADLDGLQKLRGEKRSQYLHHLIRDLARLQFGYNHSRRTELAWNKYNDNRRATPGTAGVSPARRPDATTSPSSAVKPGGAASCDAKPHDTKPPFDPFKHVYHNRCCEEPCLKCHGPNSEYPLHEVLRDKEFYKKHGEHPCDRHGRHRHLINTYCDCSCDRCADKINHPLPEPPAAAPEPGSAALPRCPISNHTDSCDKTPPPTTSPTPPPQTSNPSGPLSPLGPLSPSTPVPPRRLTEFAQHLAKLKAAPHASLANSLQT